jgi:hypothetical protein
MSSYNTLQKILQYARHVRNNSLFLEKNLEIACIGSQPICDSNSRTPWRCAGLKIQSRRKLTLPVVDHFGCFDSFGVIFCSVELTGAAWIFDRQSLARVRSRMERDR